MTKINYQVSHSTTVFSNCLVLYENYSHNYLTLSFLGGFATLIKIPANGGFYPTPTLLNTCSTINPNFQIY